MTKQRLGLRVAGAIFALLSLAHVVRLIAQVEVRVGTQVMPMWVSVAGMIVGAALAVWFWSLASRNPNS